jgi:carbonic anhydrase/acetyltransferase-like protein (isoleucine patch superfamily)
LWYNVIVRGDVNRITLGCETNLQDGVIVHATYQQAATTIGDRVSVGHAAIVHGCTLEDECLIGMGAKVLDHAIVHSGCLVAAGALVPPGSELAGGYLYAGVPAKQLRPLKPDEEETIAKTAASYQMYAGWYRGSTEGLPPGLQHEP